MEFVLHPIPPFRLDLTACVLRRMPINKMDIWDADTYRRLFNLHNQTAEVSVTQTGTSKYPELLVNIKSRNIDHVQRDLIASDLKRMLGLDIDLTDFYKLADSDPKLYGLVGRFVGFKPPRAASIFETLVNAIACQQLSLTVGITLLNRLSATYGKSIGEYHAFPGPIELVNASTDDLRTLGFSTRKAEYILDISRSIVSNELDLESLVQMDDETIVTTLCKIHGIGRWTAEYIALRGFGRLNVYPADDIGNQNKLQHWFHMPERPDYQGVHNIIDKWSPYRGMIYFHLLLDTLVREGLL